MKEEEKEGGCKEKKKKGRKEGDSMLSIAPHPPNPD